MWSSASNSYCIVNIFPSDHKYSQLGQNVWQQKHFTAFWEEVAWMQSKNIKMCAHLTSGWKTTRFIAEKLSPSIDWLHRIRHLRQLKTEPNVFFWLTDEFVLWTSKLLADSALEVLKQTMLKARFLSSEVARVHITCLVICYVWYLSTLTWTTVLDCSSDYMSHTLFLSVCHSDFTRLMVELWIFHFVCIIFKPLSCFCLNTSFSPLGVLQELCNTERFHFVSFPNKSRLSSCFQEKQYFVCTDSFTSFHFLWSHTQCDINSHGTECEWREV